MTAKSATHEETFTATSALQKALMGQRRWKLFGLAADDYIKYFFAGNAWVAIIVLFLITISLFGQAYVFFPRQYDNLQVYRLAGMEYVDILRDRLDDFKRIRHVVTQARLDKAKVLAAEGKSSEAIVSETSDLRVLSDRLDEAAEPLDSLIKEMGDKAVNIKERYINSENGEILRQNLLKAGKIDAANNVTVEKIDFGKEISTITDYKEQAISVLQKFEVDIDAVAASWPTTTDPALNTKLSTAVKKMQAFAAGLPKAIKKIETWDQNKPVHYYEVATSFLFGTEWTTESFWQDWFGFIPLFTGSLLVCFEALVVAVPLGVGAAIYVNQVAGPIQQNILKPFIEFIAALPSVVLGFFGVVILGELLKDFSAWPMMKAICPFFPIASGLNATTAALLLALMAVPTIFTLSEDSLNNVPRSYKEASYALGATRLQTTIFIIVPAAISGIISAALLGLGRVIGETMVVLLCAGGAVQIPPFSTQGIGAFFAPVHTMTGLIAQEVSETPKASLQWGALFMLAMILFFLSLAINWIAQLIVRKFKIGGA